MVGELASFQTKQICKLIQVIAVSPIFRTLFLLYSTLHYRLHEIMTKYHSQDLQVIWESGQLRIRKYCLNQNCLDTN